MSGGGGGDTTTTTQQTFSPTETAARNLVFSEAEKAFNAQQSAVRGQTPGTPAQPGTPAVLSQPRNDGRGMPLPGTGGQVITPATPGTPAIPGQQFAQPNTPAGNVNPASAPVPFSPETILSQLQLGNFAVDGAQQGANTLQNALQFGLNDAVNPDTNPVLQDLLDATRRRMTEDFLESGGLLQQVRQNSVNAGQVGGTRGEIAEGLATGKASQAIADAQTQIINNAFNKGQDTFARTLAFGPQTIGAGTLPAQFTGAIGAQKENLSQLLEDFAASGRQFDLNAPFTPVQNFANIVNGTSAPGTIVTGSQPRSGGGLGGIISGGLGGAGAGAMIGSVVPGIGTAVGAGVGGLMGVLGGLF